MNVIWASRTVKKPKENFGKKVLHAIKRSIREIPVTMSAFNIGIFVTPIINVRDMLLNDWIPMAPAVPIIVAIMAERSAIVNVVYRALIISAFWNKLAYHFKENPPHLADVFDELKERTINVIIGAYNRRRISPR